MICAKCITKVIISVMELCIPHTFSNIKAKSPGITLLVLVLSKIEKRLINGTVVIHLLKLMSFTFMSVSMPNLLSNLLKIHSTAGNVKIFLIMTLLVISGI